MGSNPISHAKVENTTKKKSLKKSYKMFGRLKNCSYLCNGNKKGL